MLTIKKGAGTKHGWGTVYSGRGTSFAHVGALKNEISMRI